MKHKLNNRFLSLLFLLPYLSVNVQAQNIIQYEEELKGQILLTEKITIPVESAGYTLILPDDQEADGLVIFLNSNRDAGKIVGAKR